MRQLFRTDGRCDQKLSEAVRGVSGAAGDGDDDGNGDGDGDGDGVSGQRANAMLTPIPNAKRNNAITA